MIYADKFRTRKGVYAGFISVYNKDGNVLGSNSMAFTNYDSVEVDGKKVFRKEAFNWAGVVMDKDSFVYLTGVQTDTLLPVWNDSLAPRKAWTEKSGGINTSKGNTFLLKYKLQPGQWPDLAYTKGVINNDELDYDRPLGLHYENGKLYVAGTYGKGTEKGIYAAAYNTNLEREYIQYHAINGGLQFQQTKFADGKIFVCGGLAKNGEITIGNKVIPASTTAANSGMVFIMNLADGTALDAAVNVPENDPLNITVAAYPTDSGYVAYNHETLNGIEMALHYDANMNLVSVDTIAQGGGSSTISAVGHSVEKGKTAIGLRASYKAPYYLLDEEPMQYETTNWYSVVAVINTANPAQGVEEIEAANGKAVKFIENGLLYIRRDGKLGDDFKLILKTFKVVFKGEGAY